jgi:dimethylaniline monooxygenase (N-oxide forming)
VITTTVANQSKQRSCFQDFPFPDDTSVFPPAEAIAKYLDDYADHFELKSHCRMGASVDQLSRSGEQWEIKFSQQGKQATELFDRVVVTTGAFHKAFKPTYEGIDKFKGKILHSQGYKDSADFKGKRVLVVGMSITGGDVCNDLCKGTAAQVYLSHRHGARFLARLHNGKPADHAITRRRVGIGQLINRHFPNFVAKLGTYFLERKMLKEWPYIDPSWNLLPAPPILNSLPVYHDETIPLLASGKLISVPGIKRFNETDIEFVDGTKLESIDAVIFCTGYYFNYTILSPSADPTIEQSLEWAQSPHNNGLAYPRLYMGILSPVHPTSLAFIGPFRGHSFAAFSNADLASQALAQLWLGHYPMPYSSEMSTWCDANYVRNLSILKTGRLQKVGMDPGELESWLNKVAGNGMNEMFQWGRWEAWRFWWNERELYKLIMDGIDTPFVYRLFDSPRGKLGRPSWDGAREAIYKANGRTWKSKVE